MSGLYAVPVFIQKLVSIVPGEKYLGPYRAMPFFALAGATFQFFFYYFGYYEYVKRELARSMAAEQLRKEFKSDIPIAANRLPHFKPFPVRPSKPVQT